MAVKHLFSRRTLLNLSKIRSENVKNVGLTLEEFHDFMLSAAVKAVILYVKHYVV